MKKPQQNSFSVLGYKNKTIFEKHVDLLLILNASISVL